MSTHKEYEIEYGFMEGADDYCKSWTNDWDTIEEAELEYIQKVKDREYDYVDLVEIEINEDDGEHLDRLDIHSWINPKQSWEDYLFDCYICNHRFYNDGRDKKVAYCDDDKGGRCEDCRD